MTRTVPAALQTHLDGENLNLVRLWSITRLDGAVLRLTDADTAVTSAAQVYSPLIGFSASSLLSALGNYGQEMTMTLAATQTAFTEADIRASRWRYASVRVEVINRLTPSDGVVTLFAGRVTSTQITDTGELVIEMESRLNPDREFRIDTYSASCRADLGDSLCQVDIDALKQTFTVAGITSTVEFSTIALNDPDDTWAFGLVTFTTGDNAGISYEVATNVSSSLSVILMQPTNFALNIGDTGTIYPGCDKTPFTCNALYSNIVNYQGEPYEVNLDKTNI